MTVEEKLILLLVDKVLLAGIAGFAWHIYRRRQQAIEREQARVDDLARAKEETAVREVERRQIRADDLARANEERAIRESEREQARADHLERANEDLARETTVREIDSRIHFLERRLGEFYWPLMLCMKKDDAVWQRVPALYDDGTQLPSETGELVEQHFLLPNHDQAVTIIERNYHLVADTEGLVEPMIAYIRHVAVFRALRAGKSDKNPIDVDEPFPPKLISELEQGLKRSKAALNKAKAERANCAPKAPTRRQT